MSMGGQAEGVACAVGSKDPPLREQNFVLILQLLQDDFLTGWKTTSVATYTMEDFGSPNLEFNR